MKQSLLGFLAGAVFSFLALTWLAHSRMIVRTEDGLRVVPKVSGNFQRLYVDVREWGALDFVRNRDVTEALARDGWAKAQASLGTALDKMKHQLEDAKGQLEKQLQR